MQWPPNEQQDLLAYLSHPAKAMGLLGSHLTKPETPENQLLWAELYQWFASITHLCFSMFAGAWSMRRSFLPDGCKIQSFTAIRCG